MILEALTLESGLGLFPQYRICFVACISIGSEKVRCGIQQVNMQVPAPEPSSGSPVTSRTSNGLPHAIFSHFTHAECLVPAYCMALL